MKIKSIKMSSALRGVKQNGYALISTLMIMTLLMVVAMGMLSFSSSSVTTSTYGKEISEAKANARMALMLAIGELQMHTGKDTRITAPADIVETGAPPLTGVWKSWEGTNHDSDGRPIQPDYTVKTKSESNSGHFLTWLVSGAESVQEPLSPAPTTLISSVATADTIPLLGVGTLGVSTGQVHVTPQLVNGETGAIGWWVSPENQKSRLLHPYAPRTDDAPGWSDLTRTHSIPDPEVFGLEDSLSDLENYNPDPHNVKVTGKAITLDTTEFLATANPAQPQQSFHDLSTTAMGLLTNSATGGWRKDMSILSEKWDDIYSNYTGGQLPLFRYTPVAGSTSSVPKPEVNSYDPDQSNFYPWSNYYLMGLTKYPATYHTASASWQNLVYFANLYKTINYNNTTNSAEVPFGWKTSIAWHRGGNVPNAHFFRHYHELGYDPVVARIQLIVQANAIPDPNPARTNPQNYHKINLRLVPIVTLWNPYNVSLSKELIGAVYQQGQDNDFGIGTQRSLPITLSIINGTQEPAGGFENYYRLLNGGNSLTADGKLAGDGFGHYYDRQIPENIAKGYNDSYFGDLRAFTAWLPLEFSLEPGEAKSYAPITNVFGAWSAGLRLKNGYSAGDDFGAAIVPPGGIDPDDWRSYRGLVNVPGRSGNQLLLNDQVKFAMRSDRFTKIYSNTITNKTGAGAFFSVGTPNWPVSLDAINNGEVPKGTSYLRQVMAVNVDSDWAAEYWPNDELDEIQYNVSELVPGGGNPAWTNIFSISFGPRLTFGAGYGNPQNRPTKGVLQASPLISSTLSIPEKDVNNHPVHNSYDLSYSSMPINSNLSPEVGTEGYIVSGFQSGDGLSRLIMAEIPFRPLASLPELQNWNIRGNNPLPPYQHFLIGNSDATPLIQQDGILPNSPVSAVVSENLQHDDAYCANHLLFDDWFFSSISPQPTTFGRTLSRSIEEVYRDFLQGNDRLTNRSYRAISEDQKLSAADANTRITEILNSPAGDGFLKVASRFEVEGMFNINSTSVKAWRALLGHARKQEIAYYSASGITHDTTEYEHVVSRFTVASDVKAGNASGEGAAFQSGSEYAGFRTLSDSQLDDLADNIVDEIKKRGPFLSLSEFVNRQLNSSDEDLALSGAVQAALNSLSENPNAALMNPVNQLSSETMDPTDAKLDSAGYAFEAAAEGMNTHGFPGWIRQADILRPIAPVLSARDDTFTIRAYGDSRDEAGNVVARAWCEATVQRRREFVDPADPADSIEPPTNAQNIKFGRKYEIITFRWLSEDEV